MSLRSWVIRGFILAGVALLAAFGWVANSWVSPERVREQVIATLDEQFEGVDVHVGSARMRILGGIAVTDLSLDRASPTRPKSRSSSCRRPSSPRQGATQPRPAGHQEGRAGKPRTSLERGAKGSGMSPRCQAGPRRQARADVRRQGGTIHITDKGPDPLPSVTLTDAHLTLLNDPLPMLAVQARAPPMGYGLVHVRARINRINGGLSLGLEMPDFPLGESAVASAEQFAPDLAPHLGSLTATAAVLKADLNYLPESGKKWRHDVQFEVKDARFEHPDLPWPVEKIAANVRSRRGKVTVEDATAQIGAVVHLSLETRTDPAPPNPRPPQSNAEDPLRGSRTTFSGSRLTDPAVPLDDDLFERLPDTGPPGAEDASRRSGRWTSATSSPAKRAGGSARSRSSRSRSR